MPTFRTALEPTGGNDVGIVVPEEIVLSFERGKRVPVVVTIYRGYADNDRSVNSTRRSGGSRAAGGQMSGMIT